VFCGTEAQSVADVRNLRICTAMQRSGAWWNIHENIPALNRTRTSCTARHKPHGYPDVSLKIYNKCTLKSYFSRNTKNHSFKIWPSFWLKWPHKLPQRFRLNSV
jgi:hypothetical protein